nr:hypothetical protein Iba_chr08fCG2820 [Ipomoea batatas]
MCPTADITSDKFSSNNSINSNSVKDSASCKQAVECRSKYSLVNECSTKTSPESRILRENEDAEVRELKTSDSTATVVSGQKKQSRNTIVSSPLSTTNLRYSRARSKLKERVRRVKAVKTVKSSLMSEGSQRWCRSGASRFNKVDRMFNRLCSAQ